jgi:hypothetical protein
MHFAAHESFHIRDGWLRKGLLNIERNPYLFSEEHAGDDLGVGRNMVSSRIVCLCHTKRVFQRYLSRMPRYVCVQSSVRRSIGLAPSAG